MQCVKPSIYGMILFTSNPTEGIPQAFLKPRKYGIYRLFAGFSVSSECFENLENLRILRVRGELLETKFLY